MTQPNPDKVSASGHFYTDDEVREAEVEAHRIDPLADEKKLLDLVVEGLAERRSGLPENPDARPVETVTLPALAVDVDPQLAAGTLYPTCSAWALAKLDQFTITSTRTRLVLFALAADADRGLHSPNGYNGTTVDRLKGLTGLGSAYTVWAATDLLREADLIVETHRAGSEDDEVSYRLPERFLAYMRD